MGYSFTKEMHVCCSDRCADFVTELANKMVMELRKQEKVKDNFCNTSGMVNVAMTLQDCFMGSGWHYTYISDYMEEFIPRFEKWIEKEEKDDWDSGDDDKAGDEKNKQNHLKAYRIILENLKRMVE